MNENNIRNVRLDFLRIVCCVLIVCMHNTYLTSKTLLITENRDYSVIALRMITRVAVPVFMGLSGYFMFFFKERDFFYGIKRAPRYIVMLVVWSIFYLLIGFDFLSHGKTISYLLGVFDKTLWHLWYLKLYVVILITFPIVKAITANARVLRYYIIMWFVLFSLRFTLGIAKGVIPSVESILQLVQFPLFEYKGYVGGTLGSEWPTAYMGVFVVVGAFINLMEQKKLSKEKTLLVIIIGGISFFLAEAATIGLALWKTEYMPYFEEPVEVHVVLMSLGFIALFYTFPMEKFLEKNQKMISKLAECTLGVYIIHEYVRTLWWKSLAWEHIQGLNIFIVNVVSYIINIMFSFLIVLLIRKIVPQKIVQYLM